MCCAGALEDGSRGVGVVVRPPFDAGGGVVVRLRLAAGRGGGGGRTSPPPLGRGGGGVVVTPRRLKQLTPGYGELSLCVQCS